MNAKDFRQFGQWLHTLTDFEIMKLIEYANAQIETRKSRFIYEMDHATGELIKKDKFGHIVEIIQR